LSGWRASWTSYLPGVLLLLHTSYEDGKSAIRTRVSKLRCLSRARGKVDLNALPSRRRARARRGHGGRHARPASSPHASTPGNGGPASTRPAPRRADPRVPVFQFAGSPPAPARARSSARRGRRRGEELEIWNPGNLGSPRRPAGSQVGEESLSLLHAPVHTRTWVPPRGPSGSALASTRAGPR